MLQEQEADDSGELEWDPWMDNTVDDDDDADPIPSPPRVSRTGRVIKAPKKLDW